MEAIAKHDFNATADDELSFRKNQVLKVCEKLFKYVDVQVMQNTYFGHIFFRILCDVMQWIGCGIMI